MIANRVKMAMHRYTSQEETMITKILETISVIQIYDMQIRIIRNKKRKTRRTSRSSSNPKVHQKTTHGTCRQNT